MGEGEGEGGEDGWVWPGVGSFGTGGTDVVDGGGGGATWWLVSWTLFGDVAVVVVDDREEQGWLIPLTMVEE